MEIRQATEDDIDGIRGVARESLEASYSQVLDQDAIDTAVSNWYDDETLQENLGDTEHFYLVADDDGKVVAFSESLLVDETEPAGEILWLHVLPNSRGEGVGTRLLEHTEDVLQDMGADYLAGLVIAENEVGNEFYRDHGYSLVGERDVEVTGVPYTEREYRKFWQDDAESEGLEIVATSGGETLYVDHHETLHANQGPFFAAYRDGEGENLYGWLCSNCDSFDNAMDSMGRLECNSCGNKRRPLRWDAAYL
ncbi:GNAT family N-acetyltransferase [Halobacteriaceae archaeon GCM10025711]